jgi:hypothetical protein
MDLAMDLDLPQPHPQSRAALMASIPHDKRWEFLKDVLEPLYFTQSVKYIADFMKKEYGFHAK